MTYFDRHPFMNSTTYQYTSYTDTFAYIDYISAMNNASISNEFMYPGKIKRQEICPTGYIFLTNITYRQTYPNSFGYVDEYDYYLVTLREYRQIYQDIYVGDAFDIVGNKLPNALSIYVKKKPRRYKANRIRKYLKQL